MNIQYDLSTIAQAYPAALELSDGRLIELLTERMLARQQYLTQLSKTYRELEHAHQRLARTEQIQGQFLTLMRDQFQDNLENMRVLLSALTTANLYDDDLQTLFEMMVNEVLSIEFHIDNISMASRIDSGTLTSQVTQFALGALLAPLEQGLCHLFDRQIVNCEWQIDETLHIYQDQEKLLLILRNALSNALRFTPENGQVFLTLQALDDTHIEIVVRNQGEDIVDKEVIFDAFYQVDLSYGRAQHGLGLGLAVVKGLVSFMNGEVEMTREGNFNQLYIILPILNSQEETFERFSIDQKEGFVFEDEEWSSGAAF